jgi:hypothetical protein
VSALTAALAASVRAPHGDLGLRRSHLAAMCAAVQHDMDEGGQGE